MQLLYVLILSFYAWGDEEVRVKEAPEFHLVATTLLDGMLSPLSHQPLIEQSSVESAVAWDTWTQQFQVQASTQMRVKLAPEGLSGDEEEEEEDAMSTD